MPPKPVCACGAGLPVDCGYESGKWAGSGGLKLVRPDGCLRTAVNVVSADVFRRPADTSSDVGRSDEKAAEIVDSAVPPLGDLLEQVRVFVRRFVVIGDREAIAVALWVAHTYVYDTAQATPYLHPYSPEPGSGKTTLLDVLALVARNAIQADNLTEAVLFRMIDAKQPTLLFDEVDAVFGKKNTRFDRGDPAGVELGYAKGKQAWRCVPPSHEAVAFNVFCPKATAGLNELPGTLAHRSIPIEMQPPLPTDVWEDLDPEDVEQEAEALRHGSAGVG